MNELSVVWTRPRVVVGRYAHARGGGEDVLDGVGVVHGSAEGRDARIGVPNVSGRRARWRRSRDARGDARARRAVRRGRGREGTRARRRRRRGRVEGRGRAHASVEGSRVTRS